MKRGSKLASSIDNVVNRYPVVELARTVLANTGVFRAYLARRLTVPSLPSRVTLDITNICNLKCPVCMTGVNIPGVKRTTMSFALFEHIVNLIPNLRMLDLYNSGEPFLNKDIFKMLDLCNRRNIRTCVHTNASHYDAAYIDRIIETPPTRMHLSIDGITPETYDLYRYGGDIKKVLRNAHHLSRRIRETGKGPRVEWGFLYHRRNKHEIAAARALAKELGFKFYSRPLVVPQSLQKEWHDEKDIKRNVTNFKASIACPHLWLRMFVKATGRLSWCCFAFYDDDDIYDLSKINTPEEMLDLWNSGVIRRARSCFKNRGFREIENPVLCESCNNFQRRSGLDPKKHPYFLHAGDWYDRYDFKEKKHLEQR